MPQATIDPTPKPARLALPADYRRISECLGRAFHDDPLAEFFFPDEASRSQRFGAFARFVMSTLAPHSRYFTTDPIHGAALWQAPSPAKSGLLTNLLLGLRMAWVAGSAFGRIASMGDATLPYHPREPHWYLAVLGTEPAAQGRGIGSELLRGTLEECDRTGTLAYLESSKESNLPFYERHGFRVDAAFSPPGGPQLWAMTRQPA
ncbi:MAG: GNAT family N-acetyltransferase [Deltaproteobacteria bacterium]|nr:GNAT family N-acetyltransferase [Deltaproteobacteria bacterium]MBW2359988.1 GNAT family N-acetyltransferase [Deltaproteobacteria bacterium]